MIGGYGEGDLIVPEGQGKLPASQKLFVQPTAGFVIDSQPRKKLGDGIDIVVVFFIKIESGPAALLVAVVDVVPPFDIEW